MARTDRDRKAEGNTAETPPIRVEGLTKYYGDVKGVESLSFEVRKGEIFGFLGPNGAGKSTAIRTLLGFLKPTSGEASLLGHDAFDRRELREAKKSIGHVPGSLGFYEKLTGRDLLDYYGDLKGDDRRGEILDLFSFPLDRRIKEYSRGNRQKLALVQAFMHDPDLVVMDEPTAGLDPLMQNSLYDFLESEVEDGLSVFFSSHILSEVRRICDRVAIIRKGEVVALEEIETLLRKSGKVVRLRLRDSATPEEVVSGLQGATNPSVDDEGYTEFVLTGEYDSLVDRLSEYEIDDIEIREASLDDVFMHFYTDTEDDTDTDIDSRTQADKNEGTTSGGEDGV
ncbi:ABC transporter ATP-binding protein [Halorutilales archaeon Cl-col2-1]